MFAKQMMQNLNVSRETTAMLEEYVGLIEKWNPAINLVSKSSLADIWPRHILDSAQVLSLGGASIRSWADLGSGGGLPGIVVAIMATAQMPLMKVTLVEVDQRKSAFLRQVCQKLDLNVEVLSERIEQLPSLSAQVVSARALAPLDRLLDYVDRHIDTDGKALLSKGASFEEEILIARKKWNFDLEIHRSAIQEASVILEIGRLSRV